MNWIWASGELTLFRNVQLRPLFHAILGQWYSIELADWKGRSDSTAQRMTC